MSGPRTEDRYNHRATSRRAARLTLQSIISVSNLSKTYASGFQALKKINLDIRRGEIFALLGPNGAGKTTLISIICGIVNPTGGDVRAGGHDIITEYRAARSLIGLVPQELTTDAFETVWATVTFSRGLFGKPPDPGYVEKVLRDLSLWDRKDSKIMTLSGGMKRRVMIAKALSHEPKILFLDEPTAGVDVELRQDMWQMVRRLRENGVTIILTTHYIDEAEALCDRVAIMDAGRVLRLDTPQALIRGLEAPTRITTADGETIETTDPAGVLTRLADDHRLDGVSVRTATLEDVFLDLTGREYRT